MNKSLAVLSAVVLVLAPGLGYAASPGGVSSDLNAWFEADAGLTLNGSNNVTAWADQSGMGNDSTSINSDPNWQSAILNGNPIVDFDGDDYVNLPDGTWTSGTGGYTGFIVAAVDDSNWHPIASGGTEWAGERFWIGASDYLRLTDAWWGTGNDLHTANDTLTAGTYFLASYVYNNGTGRTIYQNSQSRATDSSTIRNHGASSNRIGARPDLSQIMNGQVAEIIVYNATLPDTARRRVESYLAIKYGFTLQSAVDYVDSAGSVIYASTSAFSGYTQHIVGVGRDDASGLGQVKSTSNSSGALLTMELENEGSNAAPAWTDVADREFFCWGDDGGDISTWTSSGAPASAMRLARVWRVSEPNGDVGLVTVSVQDSDLPSGVVGNVILYTNPTSDMTAGGTAYTMTESGGVWSVNVNFTNYNYFALGYIAVIGTHTFTPTVSPTPTATPSLTATPTATLTCSPTISATATPSPTASMTATHTPSPTVTRTPTVSPTATRSATYTVTPTATITSTVSGTPTADRAAHDLEHVTVYPNPFRSDVNTRGVMTFFNLPSRATIRIYSIDGRLVKTLEKDGAGNRIAWHLDTQQARPVASGVYLYLIESNGEQKKGKLAILQ